MKNEFWESVPHYLAVISIGIFGWVFYNAIFPEKEPTPVVVTPTPISSTTQVAYFAGGCFWSMESAFEHVPGVAEAISGYAGGHVKNPTYDEINTETTGHRETVAVYYEPSIVSYEELVEYYFTVIDPVDKGGQFVDRGESYTSAIFYMNDEEKDIAKKVVQKLNNSGAYKNGIATAVLPYVNFYPAEEYHQNFAKKNPARYAAYRAGSGRNERLGELCSTRAEMGLSCAIPNATSTSVGH